MIRPLAVVMAGMVFPFVGSEIGIVAADIRLAGGPRATSTAYGTQWPAPVIHGNGETCTMAFSVVMYIVAPRMAIAVGYAITPGKSPGTNPTTPGTPSQY